MKAVPFRTPDEVRAATPRVVTHLQEGGLIAYPTETVYGLGSRAGAPEVEALARLKGRPVGKPFLLLVARESMAEDYGLTFTPAARVMAAAFWPGPLTLVLSGGEGLLPDALRGPEGGIAVRWTSLPSVQQLIAALGAPITSTSANRPGHPTAPGAGALLETFGAAVEAGILMVLDGGVLGNVPPSTLVDCTQPVPRLVREGAIPRSELHAKVGSLAP